jgi:hypothetical protein
MIIFDYFIIGLFVFDLLVILILVISSIWYIKSIF